MFLQILMLLHGLKRVNKNTCKYIFSSYQLFHILSMSLRAPKRRSCKYPSGCNLHLKALERDCRVASFPSTKLGTRKPCNDIFLILQHLGKLKSGLNSRNDDLRRKRIFVHSFIVISLLLNYTFFLNADDANITNSKKAEPL